MRDMMENMEEPPNKSRFGNSRITHHASRITHHASRITFHVSRFTFHVSRFTSHVWLATLIGLLALTLAYQSQRPLLVDIGGSFDTPNVIGFFAPEHNDQATYRWSAAHSALYFRGVGKPLSPFVVRLQLSSGRGPGST